VSPSRHAPALPSIRNGDLVPYFSVRAFAVHLLTASGTAFALAALVAATRLDWTLMFFILGLALLVDGIDGPLARRWRVSEKLPRWSGETLDLVVDFLSYVFVPAYAIVASGLLPSHLALLLGLIIVITGALYFADTEMKMEGNYFRGFPALWNLVAFYLFVLKPGPWFAVALTLAFAILTFVPFRFIHPVRVVRWRPFNLALLAVWAVLAAWALRRGLSPEPWVVWGLAGIGLYFCGFGLTGGRHDRTAD